MANVTQIRLYREQLDLTQEQLGEMIGVTRQTIAAWERGDREPNSAQLSGIGQALGVAVDLLQGFTAPNSEMSSLLFRADDPSTLTHHVREHVIQKVAAYTNLEKQLEERSASPAQHPLDGYDEEFIEDLSKEVRGWLSVGESSPLSNVFSLLEAKGLKVIQYPLSEKISGFSAYTDEWGCVVVVNSSENHPTERKFFTALHELAHLILHRKDYQKPSQDYSSAPTRTRCSDPREKAANHLAGAILMPKTAVYRELKAYKNRWIPVPLLQDMKVRYNVSLLTILYRAEQLGLITKQQQGQQMGSLKKLYPVKEQPVLAPPENLTRMERLLYTALIKRLIDPTNAAQMLGKSPEEIEENLKNWTITD
jgi:Zn-dependent peptidase ImmA (M78 family)/DNA-binding XRE family transcriptional regulator